MAGSYDLYLGITHGTRVADRAGGQIYRDVCWPQNGVLELAEKLCGVGSRLASTGRSAAHVTSIIDAIDQTATSESMTPAGPLDGCQPGAWPRR
jgi:hypothetical protein